ncbi:hypothetical protein [Methanobrevibacter sp.]
MKIKDKEIDFIYAGKTLLCIGAGTAAGLAVYGVFLYFHIAIFGWNLGLIFAPLSAGYVETILSNRFLGKNFGAVSAFILFVYTTFYSFILKNPTLGMNLITAGSIIVILQSAFPTLVNYLLMVFLGGLASSIIWIFKKIKSSFKTAKSHIRWETKEEEKDSEPIIYFNEDESNKKLNSMDFFFLTSTDMCGRDHDLLGLYQSEIIIHNKETISVKRDEVEHKRLVSIKQGKDDCLTKLAEKVKADGGNCILDLDIRYGLIGLGGDNIHIIAIGMAINMKDKSNIVGRR